MRLMEMGKKWKAYVTAIIFKDILLPANGIINDRISLLWIRIHCLEDSCLLAVYVYEVFGLVIQFGKEQ